jgi:hypothetical protein
MDVKREKHRCPECGCGESNFPDPRSIPAERETVYSLKFEGDPALLQEGGHHH